MAQGVLSALSGGEITTLQTAITAIKTATDAVIALGYPAITTYVASTEKEELFNEQLQQINALVAKLLIAAATPTLYNREKST